MIVLIVILSLLAVLAIVFLLATVPFFSADIRYKKDILDISVKTLLFKKSFTIDLKAPKPEKTPEQLEKEEKQKEKKKAKAEKKKNKKSDDKNPEKKSLFDVKSEIDEIKNKVINPETGFDINEAIALKDKIFEVLNIIIRSIGKLFGKIRYKIEIPLLNVIMEYGTGDPASTGMLYGAISGMLGVIYPLANQYIIFNYPSLKVTPDFYGERFEIEVRCIIRLRPVSIFNAVISASLEPVFAFLKYFLRKGHK